jgi:hypothetical protein
MEKLLTMKKIINHEYELAKRETLRYWNANKDYIVAIVFLAFFIWASRQGFFN